MPKVSRISFGVTNLVLAAAVAYGVFRLLPSRWWPVDTGAAILVASMTASGIALLGNARVAPRLTKWAAALALVLGCSSFAALALTASWLTGVYGPVGKGGALILALVAALLVPYLIVLPAAELVWIGRRRPAPAPASTVRAAPERALEAA